MSELLNIGLFSFGLWMCFLNRKSDIWFVWVVAQIVLAGVLWGGLGSPQ